MNGVAAMKVGVEYSVDHVSVKHTMSILLFAIREFAKSGLLFKECIFSQDILKLFFSHLLLLGDIGCDTDEMIKGVGKQSVVGLLWGFRCCREI